MRALLARVLFFSGLTLAVAAPVALASMTPLPAPCCPGGCCDAGCPFCHHAAK